MDFGVNDYYDVLGIPRGSDEREIKRAYFKLVRKYNPESQPEEFKRIRQAYEILSDTASRQDYDGMTSYGDEIGARLKAGSAAAERADYLTAQAEFKHVVALKPQLAFARDLLGMAYLNGGQARDALAQFDILVSQQPSNPVYHLHKGYAHYALQQYAQATVAYKRALEIDPSDNRVRIALADTYTDTQQYEQALAELDAAIKADGEVNFNDFVFLMRRVQVQLLRNRPDYAELELDGIEKVLPPGDVEKRKYVATKIGALAAQMFRMRRSADANRLLARAAKLDPKKSYQLTFPAKATLPIRELPAATQTQLAAMKSNWTPYKLAHKAMTVPVLLAISAGLCGLISLWATLGSDTLWEEPGKVTMFLFFVGGALLTALAARRITRIRRSPFGKYTEVTPLYLLQVELDKLTVWPLVNLHDVSLTHHLQNGAYQNTTVRMDFGGVPHTVTIRGQQAAVDWAQHLLDTRHRTLSLLAEGLLDSEEALDLVPPAQLVGVTKPKPVAGAVRNTWLTYIGAAGAGAALLFGAAIPYNRITSEQTAWERVSGESIWSLRRYLEQFPNGKHADQARADVEKFYTGAVEGLRSRGADPAAVKAMSDLILAVQKPQPAKDLFTVPSERSNVLVSVNATGALSTEKASSGFPSALQSAFRNVISSEVMDPVTYAGTEANSFKLIYNAHRTEADQVAADFEFQIVVNGEVEYSFRRTLDARCGYGDCDDALGGLVATFANDLGDKLGVAIHVSVDAAGILGGTNPYDHRPLSPEELNALIRSLNLQNLNPPANE